MVNLVGGKMSLNITRIRKEGIKVLTIKKEAQVYGERRFFLANQIKNPAHINWGCSYPPAHDPARILPVGTTLEVLSIHPGGTSYSCAHVKVKSSTGFTFDVLATDLGRFCV
jgi:hypothetical protein